MLKLVGSFLLIAAILQVFRSVYDIVVVMNKAIEAQISAQQAIALFGWCINCGGVRAPGFGTEDVLGAMLGPVAALMFWLAIVVVGIMIYQTGKVIFPTESYPPTEPAFSREFAPRTPSYKRVEALTGKPPREKEPPLYISKKKRR